MLTGHSFQSAAATATPADLDTSPRFDLRFDPRFDSARSSQRPALSGRGTLLPALVLTAVAALTLAAPAATPTFTLAGNIFPSTPLGQSTTQNVTVTVNAAVAIQSIALRSGFTEYKLGTVSGCKTDGTTVNPIGTVCTIPVTFTPKALGSTASPATARTAPLLITDVESGSPVPYAFGLLGASTGPIVQFTPATLTRVAGAAATGYPAGDDGFGLVNSGYSGDNGPATSATFAFLTLFNAEQEPAQPLAIDSAHNLYVIDFGNQIIRRIDGATNTVTTVAGIPGQFGRTGDGGPATSAKIEAPASLVLDAAGNLYFTDAGPAAANGGYTIRMVDAATGIVNSIAGQDLVFPYTGSGVCVPSGQGYQWEPTCGDGGPATDAFLYNPQALAIDGKGNIFLLEEQGTIRRIDAVTGIITSVGNAVPSGTGQAFGMALGADGNLYATVDDSTAANEYLTKIDPATKVTTIVGGGATAVNGTTCTEQGSPFTNWFLDPGGAIAPGVSADAAGNIYGGTTFCSGGLTNSPGGYYYGTFRYNISSGLAYGTSATAAQGGSGTNGVFLSYGASYATYPAFGVADGAGDFYFLTQNQIAEMNNSQGALGGYQSRSDFQTDPATAVCAQFSTAFCETAVVANVGNAPLDASLTLSPGFTFLNAGDTASCVRGASIAPGDYCDLNIEFTPTTVGAVNGTLTLNDNAEIQSAGQQTLALTGTGVGAPLIAFTPVSIAFGNQPINTTSAPQTVTISNPGTASNSLNSYIASSTFGVFTLPGGTCPLPAGTLAAGASCTIQIAFAPTATGPFSGTLTIDNNVGTGVLAATTVTGTGTPSGTAQAVLSPTTLAFPSTTVGATATAQTVTLSNPGTAALTGIALSIAGANPADFAQTNTCAATLAAGANCKIAVTFTPGSAASFAATLSVADSASGSPQTASLSGTGKPLPAAATPVIAPGTGTYTANQTVAISDSTAGATVYYTADGTVPTVNSTKYTAPFLVSKTGTVVQAIAAASGFTNSAVASATYTFNALAPSLTPPGGTYNGPQSVKLATATAGASIYYTADGSTPTVSSTLYTAPISVAVSGTTLKAIAALTGYNTSPVASGTYTIQPPTATLLPNSLNFGNQAKGSASASRTVTLTNTGLSPLTGIVIALSESSGAQIRLHPNAAGIASSADYSATTTCGSTLAAGANCAIAVAFTPQSLGSLPGTVTVADNASNSPQTASLSGTGTAPAAPIATLTPAALTFTSTTGTASAAQTATLKNTGNAALTISAIAIAGANPADFSQTDTCGASLAAGSSCTIAVTFTPASAATFTATLSVADNAAGSPQTASLSGTGSAPIGDFSVSATPASQTVAAGSAATYAIAVAATPSGDVFNSAVALTASGFPPGATATFAPATVTPGSGSASSTLTIQTAAPTAANRSTAWPSALAAPSMALLLGGFTLLFRRKAYARVLRKLAPALILAGLGLASLAILGCGGGFALPKPTPTSQTYTIVITGAAGSDTHTATVTLTVN